MTRIEQTIREISTIASLIADALQQQDLATAEIARNVTQTADAANEMTSRIGEVSSEAVDTGRLAVEVRDNIVALSQMVEDLRHSVIRAVRSSTSEVDRRKTLRYEVDLPARWSVGGQADHLTRVSDLSEGGACIRGVPDVPQGTRGTLYLDGIAVALHCLTRATDQNGLHVAFVSDEAASTILRPMLERLAQRRVV